MKCEECKYWLNIKNNHYGACRKNAPLISGIMNHIIEDFPNNSIMKKLRGRWPITSFDDWCGEYKSNKTDYKSMKM